MVSCIFPVGFVEAVQLLGNPIKACILGNGRWRVEFLGTRHIYTWVVWAQLCLLILYCRVFQYHLHCSWHPFSIHWSCECIETAVREKVQCTSHIKYDTCYRQHAISCHITETVSFTYMLDDLIYWLSWPLQSIMCTILVGQMCCVACIRLYFRWQKISQ